MSIFEAIILGLVQGVSEFLPISSSGHLVIIPAVFGWEIQDRVFDIVVHLGTLCAVIFYFRKRLTSLLFSFFPSHRVVSEQRLAIFIALSVIPAIVIGFLYGDVIETTFRNPRTIAWSLIIWGLILYIADRYAARMQSHRDITHISFFHTMVIGCAQVLAFIPGTSRSGITITAGLFQKFSRTAAAEFSFLISIPVIALAGLSTMYHVVSEDSIALDMIPLVVGFFAAVISGFFSIWLTLAVIKRLSFLPFVIYRIIVGVVILVFFV